LAIRQNVLACDGESDRAKRMTELGNRRHGLLIRCRIPGTAAIRRYDDDQMDLAEIDRQIQQIMFG